MSNSLPSPQTEQQEQANHESDATSETSLSPNQKTLNQPDPPPPKSNPTSPHPIDQEYNSPDEEDDDDEDGGEMDESQEQKTTAISTGSSLHMDPPITAHNMRTGEFNHSSPSPGPNIRRGAAGKRKKGKGKGKGKPNTKKQQAIEEKLQSLMAKLKPIPFKPGKIPDFSKHEKLLKNIGLWDFFLIDFDRNIRIDLIAQLIASYEPKNRVSKVDDYRIMVSRADLARAFKLKAPMRKKGNYNAVSVADVDSECEALSDDSMAFVRVLVDEWVLLHEDDDTWMMPNEVASWYKVIKDGHPEKVDWGSLFWFMVEKELKQGDQLRDCYYASHLQHLIKCQREDLFSNVNEEIFKDMNPPDEEGVCLMEGPNTELTLGKDDEKEEETGGGIMIKEVEKCNEIDYNDEEEHVSEEQEEEEQEKEHGQWLLNGQNELREHFMQCCSSGNAEVFKCFEEEKEEDEEEMYEDGNKFHVFLSDDSLEGRDDRFTGNLLQAMESNQMGFDHHHHPQDDQLCNQSSVDIGSIPSFFNSAGKRVFEHDSIDSNKKLRINDSWDHKYNNKQVDFGMCVEQMQNVTERARMLYEEKEQALQHSNMNQQILLSELHKRDEVIDHLHKTRVEEVQKKDCDIYRLERELYMMESLLEGYKKALKETQKAFSEFREKAKVEEEPTYKDTGLGGLMLTVAAIEKLRKKREEEYKMCALVYEQMVKEFEDDWVSRFDEYAKKVNGFEKRLTSSGDDVKGIIELYEERKIKEIGEEVVDGEEREKEEEDVANPESEEKMNGVEEDEANECVDLLL